MPSRVLVVEDESVWSEQFRDILESMGFEVDTADGIKEAEALLNKKYVLVLLDMALNHSYFALDVQQFIFSLHQHYPDLPVVAMTGKPLTPPEMATLFDIGVAGFIYKPELRLPDFRRYVEDVLSKVSPEEGVDWDKATIRQLLTTALSEDELTTFCFDHFSSVYNNFSSGMTRGQKVQNLLDYCYRNGQLPRLLRLVEQHYPTQYAHFERQRRLNSGKNP